MGVAGVAMLLLLCVAPIINMVLQLIDFQGWTHELINLQLLMKSFGLAAAAALLALLLGSILAYAVLRVGTKARAGLLIALCLPIFIPSYIHALIWSRLLRSSDWLSMFSAKPEGAYAASIWVLSISYYPIAFYLCYLGLRQWSREHSWAATLHGISSFRSAWLQFQLARSFVLLGGIVVFLFAFADFGVPDLFQVETFSTQVFIQLTAYLDLSGSLLMSLLPLILCVPLVAWCYIKFRDLEPVIGLEETSARASGFYWSWGLLMAVITILVLIPLLFLLGQTQSLATLQQAILLSWVDARVSLLYSIAASILVLLLSLILAYTFDRKNKPVGSWCRMVLITIWVIPNTIIAIAYITLWNKGFLKDYIYLTGMAYVMALVAIWLPLGFEILRLPVAATRTSEAAAQVHGLRVALSWRYILGPSLLVPMSLVCLFCIALTFNELNLAVLLLPPGQSTLPSRIFSTVHYGPDHLLAALSMWQLILLTGVAAIGAVFVRTLRYGLSARA